MEHMGAHVSDKTDWAAGVAHGARRWMETVYSTALSQ